VKHLKPYKVFEKKWHSGTNVYFFQFPKVSLKDFFIDKINWNILEDIRDMASDDIDEYGYVAYKIYCFDDKTFKNTLVAYGMFDNDVNSIDDGVVFMGGYLHQYLIDPSKDNILLYKYVVIDKGNDRVFAEDSTKSEVDILSRLSCVYPNEKIEIGQ